METTKELVRELCKREGKKYGVNVAQMSEIVRCLCDLIAQDPVSVFSILSKTAGFKNFNGSPIPASTAPRKIVEKKPKAKKK